MKRLWIPQKRVYKVAVLKKIYVHKITAVKFSKMFFLKNAKKNM